MLSPAAPGEANQGLSAKRANQMYWLIGLANVATNLVTPLMVFWRMRSLNKALIVKYNQQVNEVGRQFISGTIGLLAYFGGGELTRGALNVMGWGKEPSQQRESDQQVGMMLGGTLMNFLGYAILRPMISTPFICKFLKKEGQEQALTVAQVDGLLKTALQNKISLNQLAERLLFVETEMAKLVKKQAKAQQTEGFPVRQMQQWIDGHLFDAAKKPLVGKAAGIATVALAGWFSAVTAILYLLNQFLGAPKIKKPVAPPYNLPLPQLMPTTSPSVIPLKPPAVNLTRRDLSLAHRPLVCTRIVSKIGSDAGNLHRK